MIDSSTILSYITSVRLGNGKWRGSTEAFINHWQNQVRLYERQDPLVDHFSDGQKCTMLENVCTPIAELRQVKNTADMEKTRTGRASSFGECISLLLSAASAYDDQFKSKQEKRQVFTHFLGVVDEIEDEDSYDIDALVTTIQANAHNQCTRPPFKQCTHMPHERWLQLSDKHKKKWDLLDESAKATILEISGQTKTESSFNQQDNPIRRVNLHSLSAYDFLQAHIHDIDSGQETHTLNINDDGAQDQDDDDPDTCTIFINLAKSSAGKLPPGDIRCVLLKTSKRQQSVNVVDITYHVSAHHSSISCSLVDCGANGAVAGTDVQVIHKTHWSVDVRGIDSHQVTDIAIDTVAGVVQTYKGPVIAIMHQYALLGKGSSIHSAAQLECFKNDVNDKSVKVGGLQRSKALDGYIIPLSIQEGLPHLDIRPYTGKDWGTLPHVFLTGELDWDPSILDHNLEDDEQ